MLVRPPTSPLFPYTTLFRSYNCVAPHEMIYWSTKLFARAQKYHSKIVRESTFPFIEELAFAEGNHRMSISLVFFRSEEHTSELQSQSNIVCRLLLEKKRGDD